MRLQMQRLNDSFLQGMGVTRACGYAVKRAKDLKVSEFASCGFCVLKLQAMLA